MGIGTSDGEYHESEFDMLVASAQKYINKDTNFQTHQQRIDQTFQDTKSAIAQGIMDPQGSNNLKAVPDETEPADVVEKHRVEFFSNLKKFGDRINSKAWDAWVEAMPESTHIEDRRDSTPDLNLLMQMPLSEVQTTLKEMGEHAPKIERLPKPIPVSRPKK